jgi:hypothetical protein
VFGRAVANRLTPLTLFFDLDDARAKIATYAANFTATGHTA